MEKKKKLWIAIRMVLYVFTILLFLSKFPGLSGIFEKYEMSFYDVCNGFYWKWAVDYSKLQNSDIVIVDIDARSVNKLGKFSTWPRTYWARLISFLTMANAKVIGLDVIFDPDVRHPEDDQQFLEAVRQSGRTITAIYISPSDSEKFLYRMDEPPAGFPASFGYPAEENWEIFPENDRLEPEFPALAAVSANVGHVGMSPDPDGVLRSIYPFYRFSGKAYPSFSLAILQYIMKLDRVELSGDGWLLFSGKERQLKIPLTDRGRYQVLFNGPFQTFRYVSMYDILSNRIPSEFFTDKIILVGTSLPALFDLRSIPIQQQFPGVEIHANVIYNLLHGKHVRLLPEWVKLVGLLILSFLVGIFLVFSRQLKGIIFGVLFLVGYFVFMVILFVKYLYWIPYFSVLMMVILLLLFDFSSKYVTEEKSKRLIKNIFTHYVSKNVAEVLIQNPELVKLGGEKKECTVLFSDIENFTNLSESLPPEFLVQIVNEYHSEMTELVFANNGFLDKYEGDAIMAVYGAPVSIGNHAVQACRTAVQMQKRLKELREKWRNENKPLLKCRIGINSGPMIVGNMGSRERFDYTVMGDAVNLAARLEGANKNYGSRILIGQETYQLAKSEIVARLLDYIQVKGKSKPVQVYQLLAMKDEADSRLFALVERFEEGIAFYLMKKWDDAIRKFQECLEIDPNDFQAKIFIQRSLYYQQHPPSEDWNGVYVLTQK